VIALHLIALHQLALHRLTLEDPYLGLQLLGTVAFAVSSAAVAVRADMDWLGVVVLAGQSYALSAVAGGAVLVLLTDSSAPYELARWTGVAITLVLRLLAIRYSWALPPIPGTSDRPVKPADEAEPRANPLDGR
jgi:uncharacterized membrane protein YeiH